MSNEKLQPYETKMQKSLDALEREYTTIRAGRANPHILDKLKVVIMVHRHHFSRWAMSQCLKHVY